MSGLRDFPLHATVFGDFSVHATILGDISSIRHLFWAPGRCNYRIVSYALRCYGNRRRNA